MKAADIHVHDCWVFNTAAVVSAAELGNSCARHDNLLLRHREHDAEEVGKIKALQQDNGILVTSSSLQIQCRKNVGFLVTDIKQRIYKRTWQGSAKTDCSVTIRSVKSKSLTKSGK